MLNSVKKKKRFKVKGNLAKLVIETGFFTVDWLINLNRTGEFFAYKCFLVPELAAIENSGHYRNVLGILMEACGCSEQLDPFCGLLIIEHLLMAVAAGAGWTAGRHQIKCCSTDTCQHTHMQWMDLCVFLNYLCFFCPAIYMQWFI